MGVGNPHPRPRGRAERPALLQKQVCEGQYGPGMAELEQQVAEHNILQKEIEAYGQQLRTLVGPVGEPSDTCPCLAPALVPFLPSEPERGLAGPRGLGMEEGQGQPRDVGCVLPCTASLTGPAFSPPRSRQDAATIRSQYRDLLVSPRAGPGRRAGWAACTLPGRSLTVPLSAHPRAEGGLVARAEPGQPVHAPAGLHTPAERPGPAAAAHPPARLERPAGRPCGRAEGVRGQRARVGAG